MRRTLHALLLLCCTGPGAALAFEFVSVATPAILYDAPSQKAKKLYVATRYLPLELIVSLDAWVKVRDQSGALFWIERAALSPKRYVVVTRSIASVRSEPEAGAPQLFQVAQGVALEWLQNTGTGWVKVRHLEGGSGYIKLNEVWGGQ